MRVIHLSRRTFTEEFKLAAVRRRASRDSDKGAVRGTGGEPEHVVPVGA